MLQQGSCSKIRHIQFVCVLIKTETSSKKRVFPKLDFIQHAFHSEIRFRQLNVPLKMLGFV